MKRYSKELIIGATAIVAVAILFFGINYLKGINIFKTANYYYVTYTNVAGLAQSAPVTINGYKIGIVREIAYEYDNPGHISVELSLDKSLKITKGTKAIIVSDMLGTASVELIMATSDEFQKVGSHLIGEVSPGLMDNISGDLLPGISAMIPKIDSLVVATTKVVSDPTLPEAIQRINNILASLEVTSKNLAAAVPSIAADAKVTLANANTITGNLTTVSSDLSTISSKIATMPLDSTLANISQASESLKSLLEKINSDKSTLGLLMNDPELYRNLNNSAASLDSLLKDVKKNPKRYISIKLL